MHFCVPTTRGSCNIRIWRLRVHRLSSLQTSKVWRSALLHDSVQLESGFLRDPHLIMSINLIVYFQCQQIRRLFTLWVSKGDYFLFASVMLHRITPLLLQYSFSRYEKKGRNTLHKQKESHHVVVNGWPLHTSSYRPVIPKVPCTGYLVVFGCYSVQTVMSC